MKKEAIGEYILSLQKKDTALRALLMESGELFAEYHPKMEALHNSNAEALRTIMEDIGYPTIDEFDKTVVEAAWLIIQHAISQPTFMKHCACLLEAAVKEGKADPIQLAYLTDRIAVFEGNVQYYGTQFDWDEAGIMNPNPLDDWASVNERRKSIGLNTLEEQIQIVRRRVEEEKQFPPIDAAKRQQAYNAWRKRVGWIK